jgi:hypothetical protein
MGLDDVAWATELLVGKFFGPAGGVGPFGAGTAGFVTDPGMAHQQLQQLARVQEASADARERRSGKLEAMGSRGTFFGGIVKLGDTLRPVMVVGTASDFVLLDAQTEVDPTGELARIAKKDVGRVRMVDANGFDVSGASIDPVRELETPAQEKYTVVLDRADGSGTSVSFLFLSGEPASFARDRFRQMLAESP